MKELRITKGEWQYRDHFSDGIVETEDTIIGHLMKWGSPEEELQANATLICDAGNTAQKCGLLPSELLRQRDELRDKYSQLLEYTSEFLKSMRTDNGELKKSIAEMSRDMASEAAAIKNTDG